MFEHTLSNYFSQLFFSLPEKVWFAEYFSSSCNLECFCFSFIWYFLILETFLSGILLIYFWERLVKEHHVNFPQFSFSSFLFSWIHWGSVAELKGPVHKYVVFFCIMILNTFKRNHLEWSSDSWWMIFWIQLATLNSNHNFGGKKL